MLKTKLGLCLAAALVTGHAMAANLAQSPKSIQAGFAKYGKQTPQCSAVKSSMQGPLQRLDYGVGKIEVLYTYSGKALESITLHGPDGARNDGQMRAMMCATAALLQAMQPEYQTAEGAMSGAAHLWKSSASAPFTMAYYFDQVTAQQVPLQLKAWTK